MPRKVNADMVRFHNRLLTVLSVEGGGCRSLVALLKQSQYRYQFGINDDWEPVELTFKGDIKVLSYDKFYDSIHKAHPGIKLFDIRRTVVELVPVSILMDWVEIAEGDEIYDVFKNKRPGSCMRYSCCREFIQLYADNPDKVKCIVFDSPLFKNSSSWLLWCVGETRFQDSTYTHEGAWVVDAVKDRLNYILGGTWCEPRDVRLKWSGNPIPYMDTMCYVGGYSSDWIELNSIGNGEEAQDVDGYHPGDERRYCHSCEGRYNEEDMVTLWDGDEICENCVMYCEYEESWYRITEIEQIRAYYKGRVQWLDINRESLGNDFYYCLEDDNYCHVTDVVNCSDGIYRNPESEDVVCCEDNVYRWIEDCVCVDDEWYEIGSEPVSEEIV